MIVKKLMSGMIVEVESSTIHLKTSSATFAISFDPGSKAFDLFPPFMEKQHVVLFCLAEWEPDEPTVYKNLRMFKQIA